MGRNRKVITEKIFNAYLNCKYKSYLQLHNQIGQRTEYEILQERLDMKYHLEAQAKLKSNYAKDNILRLSHLTLSKLKLGKDLILNTTISVDGLQASYDALKRCPGNSKLGSFSYEPVSFCRNPKITRIAKLSLTFKGVMLECLQGVMPKRGFLIYGEHLTKKSVLMHPHIKMVEKMMADLNTQRCTTEKVPIFLKHHCNICEFANFCESKALETDHLSLLRGISEKEINKHNKKGIFTVNQLSYTFRPRKPPKRAKNPTKPHHFALQALSLRENKIHIHGKPELPISETNVYFDIEGIPERDFYYLIGMIIIDNGTTTYRNYWAGQKADEENIFCHFIESVEQLPNCSLFHYGSYDATALKHMKGRLPTQYQKATEAILEKTLNVLSVIYPHVYFPVYSNSLKDIGALLGCEWSDNNASGIQSIIWRKSWEETRNQLLKTKLIQYNKEDCLALKTICDFIDHSTSMQITDTDNEKHNPTIAYTANFQQEDQDRYRHKFSKPDFVLKDLQHVNECAYFDYQREKVYIRTNKKFVTINRKHICKKKSVLRRLSKSINIHCEQCSRCRSLQIQRISKLSRSRIDLKFTKMGIRKFLVRYLSWRYKCLNCGAVFTAPDWPDSRTIYGHGLLSWCMYHTIACKQSVLQVQQSLITLFDLYVPPQQLFRFKSMMAEYYKSTYDKIFYSIVNGPLIHIDETTVKLRKHKGYIWVLTSMDKVYYVYKEDREGSFLKDMLNGFSGVLVSDFYSAYDSINSPQQKCLIHLIRDMNNDLKNNPFDNEYKNLLEQFSVLLRNIIDTVDKYGLKRRHLRKHREGALKFLSTVSLRDFSSEVAQKYKKRFRKSGEKLFTFLEYDGIPWNNNNAEHAMHWFARYRRFSDGLFSQRSLSDFLVILSVFQTCEYNNINVLKFLLAKSKDIPTTLTCSPFL